MDAYQRAHEQLMNDKKIRGKSYHLWGATNKRKGWAVKKARKTYRRVSLMKMPSAIRKHDPAAAKFRIYVNGKRSGTSISSPLRLSMPSRVWRSNERKR